METKIIIFFFSFSVIHQFSNLRNSLFYQKSIFNPIKKLHRGANKHKHTPTPRPCGNQSKTKTRNHPYQRPLNLPKFADNTKNTMEPPKFFSSIYNTLNNKSMYFGFICCGCLVVVVFINVVFDCVLMIAQIELQF